MPPQPMAKSKAWEQFIVSGIVAIEDSRVLGPALVDAVVAVTGASGASSASRAVSAAEVDDTLCFVVDGPCGMKLPSLDIWLFG